MGNSAARSRSLVLASQNINLVKNRFTKLSSVKLLVLLADRSSCSLYDISVCSTNLSMSKLQNHLNGLILVNVIRFIINDWGKLFSNTNLGWRNKEIMQKLISNSNSLLTNHSPARSNGPKCVKFEFNKGAGWSKQISTPKNVLGIKLLSGEGRYGLKTKATPASGTKLVNKLWKLYLKNIRSGELTKTKPLKSENTFFTKPKVKCVIGAQPELMIGKEDLAPSHIFTEHWLLHTRGLVT